MTIIDISLPLFMEYTKFEIKDITKNGIQIIKLL